MTQQPDFEHPDFERPDVERRFGGVKRLYGDAGLSKLQAAHIVVVGIGGVGSWQLKHWRVTQLVSLVWSI